MSHPDLHCLLGLALLAGLACTSASAQYRWKDAQGQVHASDLPPPRDIPEKSILQQPMPVARPFAASAASAGNPALRDRAAAAPAAPGTRSNNAATDPELEARRQRAEAETLQRKSAEADRQALLRAENCRRARDHLASLSTGQRLVRMNAQGERELVSDAQRRDETAQSRRVIDSDCR